MSELEPHIAYAEAVTNGFSAELQEAACRHPYWAYCFARFVDGSDIKYCQEAACKDSYYAVWFAKFAPEADVGYCKLHMSAEDLDEFLGYQMDMALR